MSFLNSFVPDLKLSCLSLGKPTFPHLLPRTAQKKQMGAAGCYELSLKKENVQVRHCEYTHFPPHWQITTFHYSCYFFNTQCMCLFLSLLIALFFTCRTQLCYLTHF